MSNLTNDRLFEKAQEYFELGGKELRQTIMQLYNNNDLEGLDWVLKHTTLDDTTLAIKDYPEGCVCLTKGKDDGFTTCWQHHDCVNGDSGCTHAEVDPEDERGGDEY